MFNWMVADFVNGRLGIDGNQNTSILTLFIIMALVSALLTGASIYYLYQFIRTVAKSKIIGYPMIITFYGLEFIALLSWILGLAFFCDAEKIFTTAKMAQDTEIALLVIGFVALFSSMALMWLLLPKFGMAFTNDSIIYIGESIAYSRIQAIIIDNEKEAIYINYQQTKRSFKRQKFSLKSVEGQFVLAHAAESGFEPRVGNEDQYFRSLIPGKKQSNSVQNSENDNK
ncbi:hypothetical protein JN01_0245 [Entomoplasma freundtii]|uniref:Uncharacterized protein n=1 Tax=Entomoplasma freundtii TaxID=74700 RepID=A0A2K8NRS2_9MOLU|nr:hypothetical protein [Entomoplasma freundtii]ATZ16545.1 hypothetical protein EFREU_v1c05240 [Entomoplasma freundtii]TDY58289.1 hypothetical protein JN01_0245 [Entomoplasma freundtii]